MEIRKEVKTIEVDFKCPKCSGFLRPNNTILSVFPPVFPHICNNPDCDYMESFRIQYPYIEYITVDCFNETKNV